MYMSMPPWWFNGPQNSNEQMTSEDFIKLAKFFEELKKDKPKDDKKPSNPNEWTVADHFRLFWLVTAVLIPIETCALLFFATTFIKATH